MARLARNVFISLMLFLSTPRYRRGKMLLLLRRYFVSFRYCFRTTRHLPSFHPHFRKVIVDGAIMKWMDGIISDDDEAEINFRRIRRV